MRALGLSILLLLAVGCTDRAISVKPDDAIRSTDIEIGIGAPVREGALVGVAYTVHLPDGTKILDTSEDNAVHRFYVGDGTVISGLDLGVRGMKRGGVREIRIPPDAGFGRGGYGTIPPNTSIIMRVKLMNVGDAF